jgi:hypothetical protein
MRGMLPIVYLHGFASGPTSSKARRFWRLLATMGGSRSGSGRLRATDDFRSTAGAGRAVGGRSVRLWGRAWEGTWRRFMRRGTRMSNGSCCSHRRSGSADAGRRSSERRKWRAGGRVTPWRSSIMARGEPGAAARSGRRRGPVRGLSGLPPTGAHLPRAAGRYCACGVFGRVRSGEVKCEVGSGGLGHDLLDVLDGIVERSLGVFAGRARRPAPRVRVISDRRREAPATKLEPIRRHGPDGS